LFVYLFDCEEDGQKVAPWPKLQDQTQNEAEGPVTVSPLVKERCTMRILSALWLAVGSTVQLTFAQSPLSTIPATAPTGTLFSAAALTFDLQANPDFDVTITGWAIVAQLNIDLEAELYYKQGTADGISVSEAAQWTQLGATVTTPRVGPYPQVTNIAFGEDLLIPAGETVGVYIRSTGNIFLDFVDKGTEIATNELTFKGGVSCFSAQYSCSPSAASATFGNVLIEYTFPTRAPSASPSAVPSASAFPSVIPSAIPSATPSSLPSASAAPSTFPSGVPSVSAAPSAAPSVTASCPPKGKRSRMGEDEDEDEDGDEDERFPICIVASGKGSRSRTRFKTVCVDSSDLVEEGKFDDFTEGCCDPMDEGDSYPDFCLGLPICDGKQVPCERSSGKGSGATERRARIRSQGKGMRAESIGICVQGETLCIDPYDPLYVDTDPACGPCSVRRL
jgi:hypothetical protein